MGAGPSTLSLSLSFCVIARVLDKDSWFSPFLRTAPPPAAAAAAGGGGGGAKHFCVSVCDVSALPFNEGKQ